MIVCLCTGITDRRGRELVRQGATSLYEVGLTCSAGTCSGGCRETLVQILQSGGGLRSAAKPPDSHLFLQPTWSAFPETTVFDGLKLMAEKISGLSLYSMEKKSSGFFQNGTTQGR